MWDVAREVDGEVAADATWKVSQIRLEFGPARTIGDLLAALSEVMTFSRLLPYDLEFVEAPEGTYMFTDCDLPHLDVGVYETVAPLLSRTVTALAG
jgi:hypothetical protein